MRKRRPPEAGLRRAPALLHRSLCGSRSAIGRRGFTLLEVVFALAISLVLLGTLMVALNLYRRLSWAGRQDVERAQLARSILRMIELDIRSSVFAAEEQGAETVATSAEEQELDVTIDTAEAFSGNPVGIVGDLNSLVIHANRPTRGLRTLLEPAAEELIAPAGDAKSIAYFLAVRGAAGLQGAAAESITPDSDTEIAGLARLEGDRLSMQFADTTSDLDSMAADTTLLAEEVNLLEFRYFDGLDWYETWDSTAYGQLPNAIEIIIGFRADDQAESLTGDDPSTALRYVVWIPTAEPAILSSQETTY